MKIQHVRAFRDNFIFVAHKNGLAMVVDPGDAGPVLEFLEREKLKLHTILLTHCHDDHIGGVKDLLKHRQARVLGPANLRKFGIFPDMALDESQNFEFEQTYWQCLELPGHTLDHLGYFDSQQKILFCGDVLFSMGCGRLFEGTFEQGFDSLKKLASLDPHTKIYCAHEYTLANCNFHIQEMLQPHRDYLEIRRSILERLANNEDTIPTKLEFELKYNSFLRSENLKEFTELRSKRNQFKNEAT